MPLAIPKGIVRLNCTLTCSNCEFAEHSIIQTAWCHAAAMLRWIEFESVTLRRTLPTSLFRSLVSVIAGLPYTNV